MSVSDIALEARLLASLADAPSETIHAARVAVGDFVAERHAVIYGAMLRLSRQPEGSDTLGILRDLEERGELRRAGGRDAVLGVLGSEITLHVESLAADVRRRAQQRRLGAALLEAKAKCDAGELESATTALRAILDAAATSSADAEPMTVRDVVQASIQDWQDSQVRPRVDVGLLTSVVSAMTPGTLTSIGGSTGAGKSSLGQWLGERLEDSGRVLGWVSLEDAKTVVGDRFLGELGGVDFGAIRRGERRARQEDQEPINRATIRAQQRNTRIVFPARYDVETVIRAMGKLAASGCDVIFIDYLQQMSRSDMGPRASRAEMLSSCVRDMKAEAKRLGVPLLLASQLTRPPDKKMNAEPTIYWLKETGDLENMSDGIVLLWRTGDGEQDPTMGKVAKLKNGGRRPRFTIRRNEAGAISALVPASEKKEWSAFGGSEEQFCD